MLDTQLERVRELAGGKQRAADYERRFDKAVGDRLQTDADALTALLHEHTTLRQALQEIATWADDTGTIPAQTVGEIAHAALNQGGPDEPRKGHVTAIRYSGVYGLTETPASRAVCSCGWRTGWDNGWRFVTRLRVRRHRRKHRKEASRA